MLDTTKLSLFLLNYRRNANLHLNLRIRPKAKKALINISDMQAVYKEMAKQIRAINNKTAIYNHKKRKNRP